MHLQITTNLIGHFQEIFFCDSHKSDLVQVRNLAAPRHSVSGSRVTVIYRIYIPIYIYPAYIDNIDIHNIYRHNNNKDIQNISTLYQIVLSISPKKLPENWQFQIWHTCAVPWIFNVHKHSLQMLKSTKYPSNNQSNISPKINQIVLYLLGSILILDKALFMEVLPTDNYY